MLLLMQVSGLTMLPLLDNAIDEICAIYTNHKLDNNEAITVVGKDAMVLAAYSEGLIQSAATRSGT